MSCGRCGRWISSGTRHMWRRLPYFPRALSKVERRMVNSRNVKVDFSLEDMDLSEFKGKATYE